MAASDSSDLEPRDSVVAGSGASRPIGVARVVTPASDPSSMAGPQIVPAPTTAVPGDAGASRMEPGANDEDAGRFVGRARVGAEDAPPSDKKARSKAASKPSTPPPPGRGAAAKPAAGSPGSPRRRWPRWAKVLLVVGVVLTVLATGTVVTAGFLYHRWSKSIPQAQLLPVHPGDQPLGKVAIQGAFNLLMVGIDDREGVPGWGSRSDSIIIVHVNADHSQLYLSSIPRDTVVEIPAFPAANYAGSGHGKLKINGAYDIGNRNGLGRAGGVQLLALTIEQLTGITFSGAAIVNFNGFKGLVEALGGVDLCVDEKVTSIHIGFRSNGKQDAPYILSTSGTILGKNPGVTPQVYNVGCQHFEPWQALDYVRQRDLLGNGDGDYGRERHQQQFITAIMKQAMAKDVLTDPIKLDKVIRAAGGALTIDLHGISLLDWIFTLKDVVKKDPITMRTNAGKYHSYHVGGVYRGETLTDDSLAMFEAVKNDTVDQFLLEHPDFSASAPLPKFN